MAQSDDFESSLDSLPIRLEAALGPFLKGLHRRFGRDQDRLHLYHNDLYREAMRRARALPEDDPRLHREEQRAAAIGIIQAAAEIIISDSTGVAIASQ